MQVSTRLRCARMENFFCCPVVCVASYTQSVEHVIKHYKNSECVYRLNRKEEKLSYWARQKASDENQNTNPDP